MNIKKMYNEELKEEYLNEFYNTDESRDVVANYFYMSYLTEFTLSKDLFEMNEDELVSVFRSLELKTYLSVKGVGSYFKNYISWAIQNGHRASAINPLSNVDDRWYRNLIDNTEASFWTREYIETLVEQLPDYQDKAFIMLVFEGVYGKELSEVRNLKWSDVDPVNKSAIVYEKDGESRIVNLTPDTISLIKLANESLRYTNINGKSSDLNRTDYVFKKPRLKTQDNINEPMTQLQLLNRLRDIQRFFNIPRLKPNNINRSGMLYLYYKMLLEKNNGELNFENIDANSDLEKSQFDKVIAIQYNWSLLKSKLDYTFYNTSTYRKSFLNLDTVIGLYKEEYSMESVN